MTTPSPRPASVIRRMIPIIVGWERLPLAWSIHGADPSETLVEPVPVVLLDTELGWVLLDTGLNSALISDPPLFRRLHGRNKAIEPILPDVDGEALEVALGRHGLELKDVRTIVLSHLHNDHAGGLRLFDPRVPVHVQRRELDYGLRNHPAPERHGMFRIDYDDSRIDWRPIEGDAEILPGLTAILTPGHTPGHQSFSVELMDGSGYLLAFDAADLTANLERELAVGGFIDCDARDTVAPIRRLKRIAAARDLRLIPGHDPDVWPALMAELTPEVEPLPMPNVAVPA